MLFELIDALGTESIERELADVSIRNTVVFIIDDNGTRCLNIENDGNMEQLEDVTYLKKRLFYTKYMNSNKAVVIKAAAVSNKLVISANKFSMSFNIKTFLDKFKKCDKAMVQNEKEMFIATINEYYESLKTYTEHVDREKDLILIHAEEILEEILKKKNEKKVLRIFIADSVENYQNEFNKYFYKKIFDKEIEKGYGRVSAFITLNQKKPLLSNVGGPTEEIQLYSLDDAVKLYKLKFVMDNKFNMHNALNTAENKHTINVLYNPKEKYILDYEQNPYLSYKDDLDISIIIRSIVCSIQNDIKINTYSDLVGILNRYCDFSLGVESKNSSDKKMIYHTFKNIIKSSFEDDGKRKYIIDKLFLRANIGKLLSMLINYNRIDKSANKNGYMRVAEILNIKIQLEDYFGIKGGNNVARLKEIKEIKESFTRKVLSKDVDVFDVTEEGMFAAGQLAYYLNKKNRGKHVAKLIANYHNVKTYDRLMLLLKNDMKKYDYDIYMDGREMAIYSAVKATIMGMDGKNISKNHLDWFELGLFGENLFYAKASEIK